MFDQPMKGHFWKVVGSRESAKNNTKGTEIMRKKTFAPLAVAGLLVLGFTMNASAATVYCPGELTPSLTRQVKVTGAKEAGYCYYQGGNFQGDDFPAALDPYTLIDKDIASSGEGQSEGGLFYTVDSASRISGTWTLAQNFWDTYETLYLAMHFGNGSGDPDSFIVELDRNTLTGTWALLPTNLANGLSNIYLIGRGTATSTSTSGGNTSGTVPESASTLTLLGFGLLGLGFARRRSSKR